MEAKTLTTLPLIVITGPTASGKTSLAIDIAQKYGGEIICADSRTVYKEMDIGTAKPTKAEQALVTHWGIDLIAPGDKFSAADFKQYAVQKIAEIRARGHVPFLVGGTGLYIDSVIFDYQFGVQTDVALRRHLESMTIEELHIYCNKYNISLPENRYNKRYVIRAIERRGATQQREIDPLVNTIIVGITTDRDILRTRIKERAEHLFDDGVVNEAIMLGEKYGWNSEAMTGNIYPLIHAYVKGELAMSEMQDKSATLDWRLAKRQLTWLRRNKYINWLNLEDANKYLVNILAAEYEA